MATFSGNFCFLNMLGQKIKTGFATHATTQFGTDTIVLNDLEHGKTSASIPFVTNPDNTDNWRFDLTLADNTACSVVNVNCGFKPEDAGKTVILQAIIAGTGSGPKAKSFYVAMPRGAGCNVGF